MCVQPMWVHVWLWEISRFRGREMWHLLIETWAMGLHGNWDGGVCVCLCVCMCVSLEGGPWSSTLDKLEGPGELWPQRMYPLGRSDARRFQIPVRPAPTVSSSHCVHLPLCGAHTVCSGSIWDNPDRPLGLTMSAISFHYSTLLFHDEWKHIQMGKV